MREIVDILKLVADKTRLRILMMLDKKELCVCQLMAVLEISQPLVSKNVSLLLRAGFLDVRREGKMVFYKVNSKIDKKQTLLIEMLREMLKDDETLKLDMESLIECTEYQKQTGKCGLEAYKEFMYNKRRGNL